MAKVHKKPKSTSVQSALKNFLVSSTWRDIWIYVELQSSMLLWKKFMHQQNMINHVAICHTKAKDKWHCQLCGKQYSSKESFQGHYKGYCTPLVMASDKLLPPLTPQSAWILIIHKHQKRENKLTLLSNKSNINKLVLKKYPVPVLPVKRKETDSNTTLDTLESNEEDTE